MTHTTIVLGCSRTKRTQLAAVVETLAGRGNAVEVVSGIDDNDAPWRDAIQRLGSAGVYILCSDESVNLRRVGHLRKLLSDAGIPNSRAWCGPVDWAKPVELLRNIEHLLESRNIGAPVATRPSGMSEMSGTVMPPPAMDTPPPMPAPDPSASRTFVARRAVKSLNWKPLAAIGGAGLLVLAAAVPLFSSDDDNDAVEDAPVAVSSVVASAEKAAQPETAVESDEETAAEAPVEEPSAAQEAEPEIEIEQMVQAATSPEERDAIFNALLGQKIRALDILLIAPQAKRMNRRGRQVTARLDFESAFTYCSELDIGDLNNWRLPTAGELNSLSSNRMLAKGVYWSETEGDSFGNARVVWSVHRKRMTPMRRSFKGARTVCVRHISESA